MKSCQLSTRGSWRRRRVSGGKSTRSVHRNVRDAVTLTPPRDRHFNCSNTSLRTEASASSTMRALTLEQSRCSGISTTWTKRERIRESMVSSCRIYPCEFASPTSWTVRNRSKELVELLGDVEKIRTERRKAKINKHKYTGTGNDALSFSSGGGRYGGFGSDSLGYGGSGSYGGGSSGGYDGGSYSGRGESTRAQFTANSNFHQTTTTMALAEVAQAHVATSKSTMRATMTSCLDDPTPLLAHLQLARQSPRGHPPSPRLLSRRRPRSRRSIYWAWMTTRSAALSLHPWKRLSLLLDHRACSQVSWSSSCPSVRLLITSSSN